MSTFNSSDAGINFVNFFKEELPNNSIELLSNKSDDDNLDINILIDNKHDFHIRITDYNMKIDTSAFSEYLGLKYNGKDLTEFAETVYHLSELDFVSLLEVLVLLMNTDGELEAV